VQEKHSEHKDVITPNMFNVDLWCTSGHADYYKANTFFIDVGKAEFGLKPSLV
jgi:threonyl-tRNA synthetase